ncbi:MAG: hypothetical protein V1837_02710 [Candidatus Woesearchaeota archaeon]
MVPLSSMQSRTPRSAVALLFVVLSLFSVACSSVDEAHARSIAEDFVRSRVVFYAKNSTVSSTVQELAISVESVSLLGDSWYLSVRASSEVNGTVKQKLIPIVIDARSGTVTEFNGLPVQ